MKATLTKKIKVHKAEAYLQFEKEEERNDIVKFLKGNRFSNEVVNTRVEKHLESIKLMYDGEITDKGNRVIKTGKLFSKEEGKYAMWYTQNDEFIHSKILRTERVSPDNRSQIKKGDFDFEEINYQLPVLIKREFKRSDNDKDEKFINTKLMNINNIAFEHKGKSEIIDLVWKWNDLESSTFEFKGELEKDNKLLPHKIESDKDLESYILKLLPDWNNTSKRLKIRFSDLKNNDEKQSFRRNNEVVKNQVFKAEFDNVKLMPENIREAEKWRNWMLNQKVRKQYLYKYEFQKLVNDINYEDGFSSYKGEINQPDIKEYTNELKNKDKKKQSTSYWHLQAPLDLYPDSNNKYIEDAYDFNVGDLFSFSDLTDKMKRKFNGKINTVVYYDKYTNTNNQQRNMSEFFDSFDEVKKKLLITNKNLNGNRDNHLNKNNKEIYIEDIKKIFNSSKSQHDRYIILMENKKNYSVWQVTSSLDFIDLHEKQQIKDSVSFRLVKSEMLKDELRDYVTKL